MEEGRRGGHSGNVAEEAYCLKSASVAKPAPERFRFWILLELRSDVLPISGTVYLMLLSWHLLLIHLKTDLIGSRVINMLNMITLLNLPEPEADQSFI